VADLSINAPLDANDILKVKLLAAGHEVFLLSGTHHSGLVVKLETAAFDGRKDAMRQNLELMRAVDPDARVEVLKWYEVAALNNFVQHAETVAPMLFQPVPPDVQALKNALTRGGKWVKMEQKRLVTLESVAEERVRGSKAGVRQFAQALNAPGGLEKLGEIIAVDLFNDNNDRFSVLGGMLFGAGAGAVRLAFLGNVGNVLLSAGQVSGLDSWDPNSPTKNLRQRLAQEDVNREWGGYLLGPARSVTVHGQAITLDAFATGVIADLEAVLGPRDRKIPGATTRRLDPHARARLLAGMATAVPKIRARLRGLAALPAMLQDKAAALGWNPI
jgi:hypothetical protein